MIPLLNLWHTTYSIFYEIHFHLHLMWTASIYSNSESIASDNISKCSRLEGAALWLNAPFPYGKYQRRTFKTSVCL